MIDGLYMELGDERMIIFWDDNWLHCGVLKSFFLRTFLVSNQKESTIYKCKFWDGLE
ncbi:hypothetical protein AHAS_Ahas14G0128900 [Arachis hypogaea]